MEYSVDPDQLASDEAYTVFHPNDGSTLILFILDTDKLVFLCALFAEIKTIFRGINTDHYLEISTCDPLKHKMNYTILILHLHHYVKLFCQHTQESLETQVYALGPSLSACLTISLLVLTCHPLITFVNSLDPDQD